MSRLRLVLALGLSLVAVRCDGTLTGIGRQPRPPEAKLPPAPVETPTSRGTPAADAGAPEEQTIVAQHLLVMYGGSKSAPKSIKRSHDEARARAFEALARIKGGQSFDVVVAAYTDEPGGAQRKGELGRFSRDMMVKPFADAAFALEVGQVSTVIESPFGFHVIRRIE